MVRPVPRPYSIRRQIALGLLAATLGLAGPSLACPTHEAAAKPAKHAVSSKVTPRKAIARRKESASRVASARPIVAPARPTPAKAAPVSGQSGMRIFRDPETGEIGPPTAAQAAEVARIDGAENLEFSSQGLEQVRHADGSVSMDLEGRFQEYLVVRKDASGKIQKSCVQGAKGAKKLIDAPAPAPAPVTKDR